MNNILCYIKDKKALMILVLSSIAIFNVILYLYQVYIDVMIYASVLVLFILIVYCTFDFYRYNQLMKRINVDSLVELSHLPSEINELDRTYRHLLEECFRSMDEFKRNQESSYYDLLDYYTLWVHQIKTPISALKLMLQSDELSSEYKLQLLKIEQYVDMALQYIRMNAIGADLRIESCLIETIINENIKKQASFFIYKKIKVDCFDLNDTVLTDEKWFSFVVEQVLSNALKYTKEGTITIYTKDHKLYIEDTGIGIKEEDLPRLFEKGFTGYNGRIDKKASGLGLYLCHEVLNKLGHKINIESHVGKGTIVSIDYYRDIREVE